MRCLQLSVLIGTLLFTNFVSAQNCGSMQDVCIPPCQDTCNGNVGCFFFIRQVGCEMLDTVSLCVGKCPCSCPRGVPIPAPKTGKCTGLTTNACFTELAQWQINSIVAKHNEFRAKHGACPVTYDTEIEAYTLGSTGFQNTCNTLMAEHNNPPTYSGGPLGENLVSRQGLDDVHNWDPAEGIMLLYCSEEACWDYNTASSSGKTGHFTQIVWKATSRIGCGLCQKDTQLFLMCNYATPGNGLYAGIGSPYDDNVGRR